MSEIIPSGRWHQHDSSSGAAIDVGDLSDKATMPGFWDTIIGFVPANPFKALVDGNILQIITFALFVGFALSMLPPEKKEFMSKIFDFFTEIFIKIMMAIMYIAPIGVSP